MEQDASDASGFIAGCMEKLLASGFDASAFETAKWAGVACLAALAISAVTGFIARIWKGASDIAPLVSENQFRWLLFVGALLIALPIATKATFQNTGLQFASSDRSFAQDVCRDQQQTFAQSAVIAGLEARIDDLRFELRDSLRAAQEQLNPSTVPLAEPFFATLVNPDILGKAVSVFYRPDRAEDAETIAATLAQAGAGVARRASDLSETTATETAQSGDIYIMSDARAGNAPQAIVNTRAQDGIIVTENKTASALSGTEIQILLY